MALQVSWEYDAVLNVHQIPMFIGKTQECVQWLLDNPEKRDGWDVVMGSNYLIVTADEFLETFGPEGSGKFVRRNSLGTLCWWYS